MSDREELIWAIIFLILMITAVVSVITDDDKPKAKPLDMDYSKKFGMDDVVRDTHMDYFWKVYRGYKLYPQQYTKPTQPSYTMEPDYYELMDILEEINQNQMINGNNTDIHVLGKCAHSRDQCDH
jgi:hypothetical protein